MEQNTHNTEQKNRKVPILTIILALLLAVAVGVIIFLLKQGYGTAPSDSQQPQTSEQRPVEKLTDSIEIPGFGALTLKAGVCEQLLAIPNPPQNFCWFCVSLYLEDGTLLWTSDLFGPGENSGAIVLTQPLEKGVYGNAMLSFQCFADEDGQQGLNGANTKLTLYAN